MSNELTDVRCPCGAEFQADSYDAGFIAGSGMCQNCDAALPPKDICTCPSGDGSLRHPCPAHPASVELAGAAANLTFINGRPAMCGCQVEYSSGGGEYSDVIYVTLCAKHSGSAILDLVATNRIALTPEYEGQWHADLYLDREIPLAKAEGATPAEAVLALMSEERIDPEQGGVDQAGGDRWDALQSIMEWTAAENIPDDRKLCLIRNAARAALAQPSPPPHPASELDFSRPLETENGDPVKWICADVIEYKSARVCVAKDTGLVYSSPYIGLKIRNVMPEQAEAERPEGPTEDELEAAGLGYPLHKEEAVKLWYSGFRSEVITVLEAWEAIGHDIGMNPDKGELLDSLRYMLEKCEAHDAALARVAELERQQPVAWMHDQPNRVDVIHRDVKDLLQRVPGSSRGIYRPLDVSEHYTIPLYAAPVAQAQHSVPEISGIGRDAEHPRAVVLYLRNEPSEEDMRAIQNFLRAISADVLTQAQHSAGYAEARQCVNCRHIGINDAADYAACHDCNWTGPEPDEDKCPGCAGENCMAAACPECGGRYDLVAEANITAPAGQVPQAWLDVQAERRRQITAEGWTPDHDDLYCAAELPRAAAAYILSGANDEAPAIWPFSAKWWKPRDARSNYVRASALILAEIERLDRAAPGKEGGVAGRRHRGLST
ncbi:hypothetical protein [Pseudomonas aeruginosa]|uniref:hypothetical protein n=1 Tax=Pseudomonas aeruginosa TaxID=287 RepID=UPI001F4ADB8A|nr:hypothetical protein [Pseudomonas aeruginosa]